MTTKHLLILGNCMSMEEIQDESVHLMITSPPYFNAPFDYENMYSSYENYLEVIKLFAAETFRVLQMGRIAALNIDDMLVNGQKYPIVTDAIRLFLEAGFNYRDRIVWKKPDGYLRISRRSGVLLQNPYPMYFYPDNLLESIVIFQKGKFDYKSIDKVTREESKIDKDEFNKNKWYSTLWEMVNVLPIKKNGLEKGIAAFPDELPYRLIKLFSYKNETVLDPFAGSGTTMKIARRLNRNSIGIEMLASLENTIKEKVGFTNLELNFEEAEDTFSVIKRTNGNYSCIEGI